MIVGLLISIVGLVILIATIVYLYSDKKDREKEKKVTCSGCIYLAYYNDGSAYCEQHCEINLPYYNEHNIRPCKKVKLNKKG